jgi:murein DD-endopeptidase MepM/ murein hydrolase activator NlpD
VSTRPAVRPHPTGAQAAAAGLGAARPARPFIAAGVTEPPLTPGPTTAKAAPRPEAAPAVAAQADEPAGQPPRPSWGSRLVGKARRHTWPLAAAAALVVALGGAVIGLNETDAAAKVISTDGALNPLRDTIEMVSRRNVMDISSRSMTARVQPVSSVEHLNSTQVSNVALVLTFQPPALEDGATLMVRRMAGQSPPETPAEGVEVPLGDDVTQVVDEGLQPDTTYSYTLFVLHPDQKPEVVGRLVTSTATFPTELPTGESLETGERLVTPSNTYYLAVTDEGQVVMYNGRNQKVWSLKADKVAGAQLVMQTDGNLVLANGSDILWQSGTESRGSHLVLSDDGDMQIISAEGAVVWSSLDQGAVLGGSDSPYSVTFEGWTTPGAGPIYSQFGYRLHPIAGVVKLHEGVDLAAGGRGGPIYAAADGVVEQVYCDSGGNWTLVIDHGDGIETAYLHWDGLDNVLVAEGDEVVAGQQVARTGNSGQSTGPHLHFEVRIDGEPVDPVQFLADKGVNTGWVER